MSFDAVMPPYNASDPAATFLASSCLDFLLIELVPLAKRVTAERETETLVEKEGDAGEEEEADAVHHRLEMQGYRVGQGLVERYVLLCETTVYSVCLASPASLRGRGSTGGGYNSTIWEHEADLAPYTDSRETARDSTIPSTSSNSFAKTSGP